MIAIINVRLTVNKKRAGITARSIHYSPFYKAAFNDLIDLVGMWGTLPWQQGVFYSWFMRFSFYLYLICFSAARNPTCWESRPAEQGVENMLECRAFLPASTEWINLLKFTLEQKRKRNIEYRTRHCSNRFGSLADQAINIGVFIGSVKQDKGREERGKNEGWGDKERERVVWGF